jgi:AcrR family transcriptional regulator
MVVASLLAACCRIPGNSAMVVLTILDPPEWVEVPARLASEYLLAGVAMADDTRSTRQRIIEEAMSLFGEQGYAATTIAQIEAAAGLSPGSGSLYRHFPSKQALLAEGVRQQIAAGEALLGFIGDPERFATLTLSERLAVIARAGLRRLDQERDLTWLLVRDLARFPDLLAEMGRDEIQPVYQAVAAWLADQAGPHGPQRDWPALAAVLVNATTHYWLLGDIFGQDPAGIDQDRYVGALAATRSPPCSPTPGPTSAGSRRSGPAPATTWPPGSPSSWGCTGPGHRPRHPSAGSNASATRPSRSATPS